MRLLPTWRRRRECDEQDLVSAAGLIPMTALAEPAGLSE